MNELKIFENQEFGKIRSVMVNNEPYFVAKDVCDILELSNPTMAISRLDEDERTKLNLGRQGETNIVNEYGLYNLILASRKPEAKAFKKWITHEVIPSIRKTGGYIAGEENMTEDELILKAMNVLNKKVEDLRIKNQNLLLENNQKSQIIEEQKPKVLFADSVETAKTSILIGEFAKILKQNGVEIGQNRLFDWLRNNNYLIKSGERRNTPTQTAMEKGLFEIKERTLNNPDGSVRITRTTKLTGKGQVYFVNKFLNNQIAISE